MKKTCRTQVPAAQKVCVIHVLFPMLHLINYNVLIDFLVPIHPSRAKFTYNRSGNFRKAHVMYIKFDTDQSQNIHARGLHFFLEAHPAGGPRSNLGHFFGG